MEVQQNPIFEDAPMEEPWSGVEGSQGTVVREDGPQTEAERPLEESTRMDVLEAPAADHEWAPPSSLDPAARLPPNLHNRAAAISDDDWLHDRDLADALDSHRSKSSSSWLMFAGLAYKSIGIVYGDLGTSPMYLWQTCFTKTATEEDIIGALSLVLWTLSLMIFKYVVVVLPANDMGEGGTFAIYSLLCRYTKITIFGLKHDSDKALSVFHQDPKRPKKKRSHPGRAVGKALEKSPALQKMLLVFVLCGTCALVGDGVLTPAVTVLSAMTGLQVPKELLREDGSTIIPNGAVIAATCVIMAIIFGCQRLGTNRISFIFAPILISFFVLNAGIGMYNIHTWNPAIFKAFSPHHGIMYLVRNKKEGWISLGGICLCITGVEGLFADLGHFNVQAIRASTLTVVYPSLLLIYLGQGAYLSRNPGDTPQAYFKAIPEPVFWPAFVVATLATMVASQAIISGVFSIISQSMSLQCFPKMKVIHTSKTVQGQIYIPNVNWALMTLGIACVLGFSLPQPSDMPLNGDALGHAFGIAVMCVMIITTCLVTLVMLVIWRTHVVVIAIFFGWFMFMESIYLSSNLFKIAHGGYVPLTIASVVLLISYSWHWGSTKRYLVGCGMGAQLEDVLVPDESAYAPTFSSVDEDIPSGPKEPLHYRLKSSGQKVIVTKGAALFYCDTIYRLPPHFAFSLKAMPAVHEVMVFMSLREIPVPHVADSERLLVKPLAYPGFYRVVARYGYMDDPDHSTGFAQQVLRAISHYLAYGSTKELLHRTPSSGPGSPMSHVSSSSALSHVGSSTALVPGPTDTPRSPSALDTPKKRPIRLSLTERGWQMRLVKEAAQHEIMYIKTKPILKPAKSATHMQRFVGHSPFL